MAKETISPITVRFWELYSRKLKELGEEENAFEDYHNNPAWTKRIILKAKEVLEKEMELKTGKEYFRVDLIGYTTQWLEEMKKKKAERQHKWKLKVVYEHENSEDWSDELCKLCYIAADLRVISAYHDFEKGKDIKRLLQDYVRTLHEEEILHRVPKSDWLFVFGPRHVKPEDELQHFRAFTLDSELNVIEITDRGIGNITPGSWKK